MIHFHENVQNNWVYLMKIMMRKKSGEINFPWTHTCSSLNNLKSTKTHGNTYLSLNKLVLRSMLELSTCHGDIAAIAPNSDEMAWSVNKPVKVIIKGGEREGNIEEGTFGKKSVTKYFHVLWASWQNSWIIIWVFKYSSKASGRKTCWFP